MEGVPPAVRGFLWIKCSLVKLLPGLVKAMQKPVQLTADAGVTPDGTASRKHGCFMM